jgi:hydroxymethylglutaryl-CoA lyase
LKNTNSTIDESIKRLEDIQNLCLQKNKQLVVYLSMGFGNPYNDPYDDETLLHWADEMAKRQVEIVSVSDTIGIATPDQIDYALSTLVPAFPQVEFGVHLHSGAQDWQQKLSAAANAGCKRFDGAMKGIGGCPMASNELVGNMNTEWMIDYFKQLNLLPSLNEEALQESLQLAEQIFLKA